MHSDAYHILVIDDDTNTRVLLRLLLEQHGYSVSLAPDGEVGLALAETQRPDLILLDVAMPRRSGMDVYLDLRNDTRIADIPVLIISASLSHRDVQTWLGMPNVADALMKPFDIHGLLGRIEAICEGQAAQVGA
jgi:two-component system phosphate regulon response regulator PhoB